LDSYVNALSRGWSPDTTRPWAAEEDLKRIGADPQAFLDVQEHDEGEGPPVTLPDGSHRPRLPGFRHWMWDGEFCGSLGFRWQPGTTELPPYCLGHIGYSVVPWKQKRGYATEALRRVLPVVSELGLPYVELVTDLDNVASQRVIAANGGVLVEQFNKPEAFGAGPCRRFRIPLATLKHESVPRTSMTG
jgi:predicted acetyltransferase